MVVRMHTEQIKALDGWIGKAKISRPEAIRQLVSWAMTQYSGATSSARTNQGAAARA